MHSVFRKILTAIICLIVVCIVVAGAKAITLDGTNSASKNQVLWLGMPRITREVGITATPSGTRTTSYQLTAGLSQVTTIATTGDGVKLPPATQPTDGSASGIDGGINVVVANAHASNATNLFPFEATTVITSNGSSGSAGAALSIPALKSAECYAVTNSSWFCQVN